MLSGLKTSAVVLAGLLLGLIIALPLAWLGVRRGADSLVANVERSVATVEARQQAMADQALLLEPLLRQYGVTRDADLFDTVQDQRSHLAGEAALRDKLERVQQLEQALLRIEKLWIQAPREAPRLLNSEPWREHGRTWELQKRLLVREQMEVVDSVEEANRLLKRWPASFLLSHKSVGAILRAVAGDISGYVTYMVRWGLDWIGYWARRLAALRGQQAPPQPPKWERPKAQLVDPYMLAFDRPVFLADAPLPEDDYQELEFSREGQQELADVELGQDKAVLENRNPPDPYHPVLPTPQATVVYSGRN